MDIVEFAERAYGTKLYAHQKQLLKQLSLSPPDTECVWLGYPFNRLVLVKKKKEVKKDERNRDFKQNTGYGTS